MAKSPQLKCSISFSMLFLFFFAIALFFIFSVSFSKLSFSVDNPQPAYNSTYAPLKRAHSFGTLAAMPAETIKYLELTNEILNLLII
jgi:hypothetical protein